MLTTFVKGQVPAHLKAKLGLAIWFHDVIYDPKDGYVQVFYGSTYVR